MKLSKHKYYYCIINYCDYTLDIGDTLKYLLVGSDEITLETVEVHDLVISSSLPPYLSNVILTVSSLVFRLTVAQLMRFMR